MRAVVACPESARGIRLADVDRPASGPGLVVVEVRAAAWNRGDLNDARSGRVPTGSVLGSDLAGVVERASPDGRGPERGRRVVGLAAGAFAEYVAVPVETLAPVPDGVDLVEAAAIPVAGLAALQSLRGVGGLDGRRVLVTGATGGVGRFAVQLAAAGGAEVIAGVGSGERAAEMRTLGARTVVTDLGEVDGPVDVVLDNVGGPQLVAAWELLAPGGTVRSIGWASGEPAVFTPYSTIGPVRSLTSFLIGGDIGADLRTLVGLLADRRLDAGVGWVGSLASADEAVDALVGRTTTGKVVMTIGDAVGSR